MVMIDYDDDWIGDDDCNSNDYFDDLQGNIDDAVSLFTSQKTSKMMIDDEDDDFGSSR